MKNESIFRSNNFASKAKIKKKTSEKLNLLFRKNFYIKIVLQNSYISSPIY